MCISYIISCFPSFYTLCRHPLFTIAMLRIWLENIGPNGSYITVLTFTHTHIVSSQKKKKNTQAKTSPKLPFPVISFFASPLFKTNATWLHFRSSSKAFEHKEKNPMLFLSFCPWCAFAALKIPLFLLSKTREKKVVFLPPFQSKSQ